MDKIDLVEYDTLKPLLRERILKEQVVLLWERDILIHEYFGVNLKRALKVIKKDMVGLKTKILKIKEDLG